MSLEKMEKISILRLMGDLQSTLYEQFKEDRGCSVALNPYTGESIGVGKYAIL